jgi:hypothetical protein
MGWKVQELGFPGLEKPHLDRSSERTRPEDRGEDTSEMKPLMTGFAPRMQCRHSAPCGSVQR